MISMAQTPLQLSKYKLIEEIGHGGMATVYRAHDTRLGRDVALKLIHRHLRQSEEVAARFNSEARAVAKLRHPNIVEVFDVSDEDEDERFLIVELIRGPTLRALLTKHGALPAELAAEIVLEIASALEHAHSVGVIHRDIKPENVLIETPYAGPFSTSSLRAGATSGSGGSAGGSSAGGSSAGAGGASSGASASSAGASNSNASNSSAASSDAPSGASLNDEESIKPRIKLTDFGIAKLLDGQGVTSTGQVLGSPAHMAPEQIEGKPVDQRADIFSLGVLFYEALVGSLPFAGKNPAQVLRNVLEGNFQPPVLVRPEIGARWSVIVTKALSRDPDERYDTVELFADAIRSELKRVDFGNARSDISRFLVAPAEYVASFPERIVRGLSESGRQARQQQDRPLATAQFSRALAYKPGDPALLKQVSGLRRNQVLRHGAGYLALVLGLGALVGTALAFWPTSEEEPERTGGSASAQPKPSASGKAVAPPLASVASTSGTAALDKRRDTTKRVTTTAAVSEPEAVPPSKRRVRALIVDGALGGSLRIDGQTKPWFGVIHELDVGEHLFEFVPPNDTCCIQTRKLVVIAPGEDVQEIRGEIPFRDATLVVDSAQSRGWKLSCPALFPEVLALPDKRAVSMPENTVTRTCTLSNPAEGSDKRQKSITLNAGQTTVLQWP